MKYEIPDPIQLEASSQSASNQFHELTTGPYRPVTEEEITQREALRAECEAQFRADFARRTAELAAVASGALTVLEDVRRQREAASQARTIGRVAVLPAAQQRT